MGERVGAWVRVGVGVVIIITVVASIRYAMQHKIPLTPTRNLTIAK